MTDDDKPWRVHSLHAPAVLCAPDGTMTHAESRISLPTPIHTADTLEDAERWRREQISAMRNNNG